MDRVVVRLTEPSDIFLDEARPSVGPDVDYRCLGIEYGSLEIPDGCISDLVKDLTDRIRGAKKDLSFVGVIEPCNPDSPLNRYWSYWHLVRKQIDLVPSATPIDGTISHDGQIGYYTIYGPVDNDEIVRLFEYCVFRTDFFVVADADADSRTAIEKRVATLLESGDYLNQGCRYWRDFSKALLDTLLNGDLAIVKPGGAWESGEIHFSCWGCPFI